MLWSSLLRKIVKNTSLKIMNLVAEAFFLFIFCKLCLLSSVEMFMNDGERHFFVHYQKKCNILEKKENAVLLLSVNETSEEVSHTSFWRKLST